MNRFDMNLLPPCSRYYDTLQLGNDGDIRPFIRFIAESTERTLDEYLAATMDNYEELGGQRNSSTESQRIIYVDNEDLDDR